MSRIRDYQFGFTGWRWALSIFRSIAVSIVVWVPVMALARALLSDVTGARVWTPWEVAASVGGLLATFALVIAWDQAVTRRRLEQANRLADSLPGDE